MTQIGVGIGVNKPPTKTINDKRKNTSRKIESTTGDDYDDEDDGDVDGIVDPLAGLRQSIPEEYEAEPESEAEPEAQADPVGERFADDDNPEDDWGDVDAVEEPLDLVSEAAEETAAPQVEADGSDEDSDELLLNADKLAEEDEPVQPQAGRRRGLVSGDGGEAEGGAGAGSTLFERMANLSRGSKDSVEDSDEEDENEEEGGSSLNIPRFLGRQNNQ